MTRPALRYHGGKFRLASWLLQFFPLHGCYVEPFGGAAGVLLRKPRVYAEVYNVVRDEVAAWLGVNDRDRMTVRYRYAQSRGPWSVRIQFGEPVAGAQLALEIGA